MRRHIGRALYAAAAALLAFTAMGVAAAGAAGATTATPKSTGSAAYNTGLAGYRESGRWFRYVSTVLTVPPRPSGSGNGGPAYIYLVHSGGPTPRPYAYIQVQPGGGTGSITYDTLGLARLGTLALSPSVGDRVALSIYYDRRGHLQFRATDSTVGNSATATTAADLAGGLQYNEASLFGSIDNGAVIPPAADIRLWAFSDSHVTTYSGDRGTVLGPWTTDQLLDTTNGTAEGTVILSPSGLWNSGQNFGAWLRALPRAYTNELAGYEIWGRQFRFASTTLTVPALPSDSIARGGASIMAGVRLNAAAEVARIMVKPGGGGGSITYSAATADNSTTGTLRLSPAVGDQLSLSIYYDRQGHDFFTATDTTQGTTQTVRVTVGNQIYNDVWLIGSIDNSAVTPPPSDAKLWEFTASRATTYSGVRGTILGPWHAAQFIDTLDATAHSPVVMNAPVLQNNGQDFTVSLLHR
jgi:hypothetical protein